MHFDLLGKTLTRSYIHTTSSKIEQVNQLWAYRAIWRGVNP